MLIGLNCQNIHNSAEYQVKHVFFCVHIENTLFTTLHTQNTFSTCFSMKCYFHVFY